MRARRALAHEPGLLCNTPRRHVPGVVTPSRISGCSRCLVDLRRSTPPAVTAQRQSKASAADLAETQVDRAEERVRLSVRHGERQALALVPQLFGTTGIRLWSTRVQGTGMSGKNRENRAVSVYEQASTMRCTSSPQRHDVVGQRLHGRSLPPPGPPFWLRPRCAGAAPFPSRKAEQPKPILPPSGRIAQAAERCEGNSESRPLGGSRRKGGRQPTLPGAFAPSTIGASGLNFSVRNGKRCTPVAMTAQTVKGAASRRATLKTP